MLQVAKFMIKLSNMLRNLWKKDATGDLIIQSGKKLILGRNRETGITERKCSKSQVEALFDDHSSRLHVKQLGKKPSFVNGKILKEDQSAILKPGDRLELLEGQLGYAFDLAPDDKRGRTCEENVGETSANSRHVASAAERKRKSSDPVAALFDDNDTEDAHLPDEACGSGTWESIGSDLHIYASSGVKHCSKIAAFDLDCTLICTKSGRIFPKDADDWQIMFAEIPKKLKQLHAEGYKLVMFSNQKGMQNEKKMTLAQFKTKIERIIQKLGVPMQVFAYVGTGKYRKPAVGMWRLFAERENGGLMPKLADSFYVGDAAGRKAHLGPMQKKAKPDHSCGDRLFALNVGLKFHTPEEFFLGQKSMPFQLPDFDPRPLVKKDPASIALLNPVDAKLEPPAKGQPEMIVMVGAPASGKSEFVKKHLIPLGYTHINRDTLKTWQKCVSECERALSKGLSVVVDNTNPDQASRKRYVDVAKHLNVKVRCFEMNVSHAHALHNNRFRSLMGADKEHADVNEMVMNSHRANLESPTTEEGFESIVKVNFVPHFQDDEARELYGMFLVEK